MDTYYRSKNLIKGTGIYAIGTFGTKILSFLIVPLYTYYISTEDMGIYDLLMSTIELLSPIITMQISDASFRWIIRNEGNSELYIRSTMQVLLFNSTLAVGMIFLVNTSITIPYCTYFTIILILTRILSSTQKLLRALKNQKLFAISGICYSAIFLSLNVVQICILKGGIRSLFQSLIIAATITIFCIFVAESSLRVNIFKIPDLQIIKEFYIFSAPLVPNYLNWWIINSSDRYIVAAFLGLSSNGILAVAHKFPTVLHTILNLFINSWQDVSIAEKESDVGKYYTRVFSEFYRLVFTLLLFLVPITKVIVFVILSPVYKEACNYIAFYYLGTVFQSFASFYGVGYLRAGKTSKAFTTSVYGAFINAIINLIFIHFIGLHAAAISTFVGFFVMWAIREKQNKNELGIELNKVEFFGYTLLCVAISFISINTVILVNIMLAIFGVIAFGYINKNSLQKILKFLPYSFNRKS